MCKSATSVQWTKTDEEGKVMFTAHWFSFTELRNVCANNSHFYGSLL